MSETPKKIPKAVMGKKEFADFIGRGPSYVTKLRKDGRLVLTPNGRGVKVVESLRLMANTRGARDDVAERWAELAGKEIPEPPPGDGAEEGGEGPPSKDPGVREARAGAEARKAIALAEQEEMKAAQMRGDLIPREAVEAALRFVGAAIRSEFEVLPDQATPMVAPVTALDECHSALQEIARSALEKIGQAIARQREELMRVGRK